MTDTETTIKKDTLTTTIDKNIKGINNHRKAASYLQAAAKSHLEAARHFEEGNHKKGTQSTIAAHRYVNLVIKAQYEVVKHEGI